MTAYYRLPVWQTEFAGNAPAIAVRPDGTFAVTAGTDIEAALVAAGAIPVAPGAPGEAVPWDALTGVPATFPPELPVGWADVGTDASPKPETFPPTLQTDAAAAIEVGESPFTYTNSGTAAVLVTVAGADTISLSQGGALTGLTAGQFTLRPADAVTVTYATTAPAMTATPLV